jgi:hypothetical protein
MKKRKPPNSHASKWVASAAAATLAAAAAFLPKEALAQASYNGISGYINTPSARMEEDGVLRTGFSHATPYSALFLSLQALPWLEVSGRFTQFNGLPSFVGQVGANYGSSKDKSVAFKARLVPENFMGLGWVPQVAFGAEDKGIGNSNVFPSYYLVASKAFGVAGGKLDASIGFGRERIDGPFGGFRYTHPSFARWALVADYDRINFARDTGAAITGVDKRKVGRVNGDPGGCP